jgi:hypothetical protein
MTGRAFDPGPPVEFAWAGDWLESYRRALETGDGDLLTSLFLEDGELVLDPFVPALAGRNAIRAYLLDATAAETQLELTVDRLELHTVDDEGDDGVSCVLRPAAVQVAFLHACHLRAEPISNVIDLLLPG